METCRRISKLGSFSRFSANRNTTFICTGHSKRTTRNGFYHFAFLAYYMLMMRFVCIKFWQVSAMRDFHGHIPSRLKKQLIRDEAPLGIDPEQSGVLSLVKRQLLPEGQSLQNLINLRNSVAHADGYINIPDTDNLESRVSQINAIVIALQFRSQNAINNCYFKFLLDSPASLGNLGVLDNHNFDADEEISAYIEDVLIRKNYLSKMDITHCIASNSLPLPGMKDSEVISLVHNNLCKSYPADSD